MFQLEHATLMYLDAVALAHIRHVGQMYGALPYTAHLAHVEHILREFGFSDYEYLASAWLHDIREMTETSDAELRERFGTVIPEIVNACTGIGNNRRVRNLDIYRKLTDYPRALPVKLADRIAHAEFGYRTKSEDKLRMYREEHPEFKDRLYPLRREAVLVNQRTRINHMWRYLDGLFIAGGQ
jgi:(p)ppGpp synthase/HD superfamily hydrolase